MDSVNDIHTIITGRLTIEERIKKIEEQLASITELADRAEAMLGYLSSPDFNAWLAESIVDRIAIGKSLICIYEYNKALSNQDTIDKVKVVLDRLITVGMEWYYPTKEEGLLGILVPFSRPGKFPPKKFSDSPPVRRATTSPNQEVEREAVCRLIMRDLVVNDGNVISCDFKQLTDCSINRMITAATKKTLFYAVVALSDMQEPESTTIDFSALQYVYLRNMLDVDKWLCKYMDLDRGGILHPVRDRENTGCRKNIRKYINAAETGCLNNFSDKQVNALAGSALYEALGIASKASRSPGSIAPNAVVLGGKTPSTSTYQCHSFETTKLHA